jgi:hypothetical protein
MTRNEARLIESIQNLESELTARMPSTLSPDSAEIANEARKIIQGVGE